MNGLRRIRSAKVENSTDAQMVDVSIHGYLIRGVVYLNADQVCLSLRKAGWVEGAEAIEGVITEMLVELGR